MALKKDFTFTTEERVLIDGNIKTKIREGVFTIKDVYIKVITINGDKEFISFSILYLKDDFEWTKEFSFIPTLETNFIAQAYECLKTLDEFKDAEDV